MKPLLGRFYDSHYKANERIRYRFHLDHFEPIKRAFSPNMIGSASLNLTELLTEMGISVKEIPGINALNSSKPPGVSDCQLKGTKLFLAPDFFKYLFEASLHLVREHLRTDPSTEDSSDEIPPKKLLEREDKPDIAFLVGGLGENEHVHHELQTLFDSHNVELVQPTYAGIAIAKGAVRFGYDKSAFSLRRARTNYGTDVVNRAIPLKRLFSKLISKGDDLNEIKQRTISNPKTYSPVKPDQKFIGFGLYESDKDIEYIDDPQCFFVTETTLAVDTSIPFKERKYAITISMDDTVISGTVREMSTGQEKVLKWTSR